MTTALIDGDCVAYRCAAVNENAEEGLAKWQADQFISRILEDVDADNWFIYLSGENNFRYQLFPEYKANRRNQPKPKHLESVREYLVLDHGAIISDGYEADDSIGIRSQSGLEDNYIICSNDKDFRQLPGTLYDVVKREVTSIDESTGLHNFYEQLLVGDSTDNIRGCPGIGKAKAPKLLEGCDDELCLATCAWQAFERAGATELEFIRDARLIWILRKEDDIWIPPLDLVVE